MSNYNSGASIFPIIMGLTVFIILMDDDPALNVIDGMSAENAEQAVHRGMESKLSPYFTACQQAAQIPAGAKSGVTRSQAETAEACLFRAHENDNDREGRITAPTSTYLKITNAPSAQAAVDIGLFEYLAPYWQACQDELSIDPQTNPAKTNADTQEFEACLYTSYEAGLRAKTPKP